MKTHALTTTKPHHFNVLGIGVSAINMQMAKAQINEWISHQEKNYVCVTSVHGIVESWKDKSLKEIHNYAGMVTPDGMPLVWLGKLFGNTKISRVYGPDLLLAVCAESGYRHYRHYFYGGEKGTPQRLAENLKALFPELNVVGTYSPPFRPLSIDEDVKIVEAINQASPDIVWVGLSTPKQERWMADHVSKLDAPVLIGIGAAFDFHAGLKKQAPLWMQRHGLEWLFRLVNEPRRLWRRYLFNNPLFIFLILLQLLKLRRYPLQL